MSVSGVETILRLLAAIVLVAGFATLSYAAAARLRLHGVLARWGAVFIAGMALATLAFHVMMPLSIFRLHYAFAALALALAATFAPVANRRLLAETVEIDRRYVRLVTRLVMASPHHPWIFACLALFVPVIIRPFLVPPVAWDFIMYHGVKAALWVQHGGAPAMNLDPGVPSWLLTRNHLAGGDVFIAWAMLPMSSEVLVGLDSLVQWIGVGLMVLLIAREIGVRSHGGTVAAAFVLALSPFRLQVGSGYVELTLAISMGATLAYTLRYMRTGCVGSLVVALAAVGLACAVKIIALPIAGLVLVVVAVRALGQRQVRPLAASVVLMVALGAPWYAYNVVDTGAPLSPAGVKVGGMPIGFTNDAYRHISRLPMPPKYKWSTEWEAFSETFGSIANARESAGWPVLVVFGVFLAALPWLARRRLWSAMLLGAIVAANVAVVFHAKFSPWRLLAPENATRFWVTAMLVATPVSTLAFSVPIIGTFYRRFLLAITLYNLVRLSLHGLAPFELDATIIVIVVTIALGVAYREIRGRLPRRARTALIATAAIAGLATTTLVGRAHRKEAMRKSFYIHSLHRGWVDPAKTLDNGTPHIVAVTHGITDFVDTGMFYYLLGRRLQNRLVHVPVTKDGTRPFNPWLTLDAVDYDRWLQRLEEAGVDHVFSMHPMTVELTWMENHPERFRKVHGSKGSWGLYELLPKSG